MNGLANLFPLFGFACLAFGLQGRSLLCSFSFSFVSMGIKQCPCIFCNFYVSIVSSPFASLAMSIAIIRAINIPELTAAPTISLMPRGTNSEGRRGGYIGDLLQGRVQGETHKRDLDIFVSK